MANPSNIVALFICVVVRQVLGFFWYDRKFLGAAWIQKGKIEIQKNPSLFPLIITSIACSFLTTYVMAHFLFYLHVQTVRSAVRVGFFLWLGFTFSTIVVHNNFANRSIVYTAIDILHDLGATIVTAILLTIL